MNRTESAVRAIYKPTGDSTVCVDERSQFINKRRAVERLRDIVAARSLEMMALSDRERWSRHTQLERGNAGLVFRGEAFEVVE